jgi:hypothetical protein
MQRSFHLSTRTPGRAPDIFLILPHIASQLLRLLRAVLRIYAIYQCHSWLEPIHEGPPVVIPQERIYS